MRRSNAKFLEMRIVATCHQLPWASCMVEPCPAPGINPPGLEENGEWGEYVNGPIGDVAV
jgi:hypothetical protein